MLFVLRVISAGRVGCARVLLHLPPAQPLPLAAKEAAVATRRITRGRILDALSFSSPLCKLIEEVQFIVFRLLLIMLLLLLEGRALSAGSLVAVGRGPGRQSPLGRMKGGRKGAFGGSLVRTH